MRFCTAEEAAVLVPSGATVLVDGSGGGINEPGAVLAALETRFADSHAPTDLTLLHVSGMGSANGDGIDYFAHEGLVRRVIGGHWGWSREMQELAADNAIEAYCLPQGTLSHLLRDIAAHRPGNISRVGIGTFVDPRVSGGRLNARAVDPVNEILEIHGVPYIFTPAFPIDVAIVRGTTADADGNISMEGEGLFVETLAAAQAARNSGGIVIAQVRQTVDAGKITPGSVKIPGALVDAVVVAPQQRLSWATASDPILEGRHRAVDIEIEPIELSVRKVIARRAAQEIADGDVVNLGFGMPDGVASVLAEAGLAGKVTFTVEQGHIGGVPAGGSDFGLARNAHASLEAGAQFDWYDGGGIDTAVLSFAEVDRHGNVNVSRFGRRAPGVGGFINISQGARRVVFMGTFVAKGPWTVEDGTIQLPETGQRKFVDDVEQISFSGQAAVVAGQSVLYVTERAVFRLTEDGIVLEEIAPDVDIERDVLSQMGFRPLISPTLKIIDARYFAAAPAPTVLGNAPLVLEETV